MDRKLTLIRVTPRHFVAGLIHDGRTVTRAAPILKYTVGWTVNKVMNYFRRKRWPTANVES